MATVSPSRIRRLRGGTMPLPQHDVFLCSGRPFSAGPHPNRPMQIDISGKAMKNTVNDETISRAYRAANAGAAAAGDASDAWISYLQNTTTDYFEVDYDANNAITSGDFHLRVRVYFSSTLVNTNNYYLFGVQGTTPDGADTAWAIFIGLSGISSLGLIISDGATRSVYASGTTDFPSAGWYDLVWERYNGTLYGYVNGTLVKTQAYSSTVNIPSATKLRVGKTTGAFGTGLAPLIFDFCQIKRRSLFAGASTIPSPKYPFPN